ncbi:hypothetical protein [Mesorhizobium sp.]|uniref:hypothetical protein n=1 Tax=Mesorhizobium sp. TaxID=1871066 RepID=UPI0025DD3F73|nr:hypothetical protein [Mesorhizobium sp.]
MMSLFLAFHVHAAGRGEGLLPELLGLRPQPRDVPKAVNENPAAPTTIEKGDLKPDPQARKAVRKPVVL